MIDLPEVRQILRDNGLFTHRSQRLNRRGQLPTKLRHFTKAEDSDYETEDEEKYELQEQQLNADFGGLGLGISGTAISINQGASDATPLLRQQSSIDKEELLAGKADFDIKDPSDNNRLKYNKELTKKQKLAHYKTPDYCIVTRADTLKVLRLELDSLVARGGVFYSIFDKIEKPEDFMKTHRGAD